MSKKSNPFDAIVASGQELEDDVIHDETPSFIKEQQELDAAAKQGQHNRTEKWKDTFAEAFRVAFWIVWFVFLIMLLVVVWHWIVPSCWTWLESDKLDKIQTVIIAVLASKVITSQQEVLTK